MAGNHGARQQKRAAKQKAKRAAKHSKQRMRTSMDPNIRLQSADKWPVTSAVVSTDIWKTRDRFAGDCPARGRRTACLRRIPRGCVLPRSEERVLESRHAARLRRLDPTDGQKRRKVTAIAPSCLVKIVQGAVDYAKSFGLPPHPDYRHTARLLAGIDPSTCPEQFEFGRNGKPFYVQGPHESSARGGGHHAAHPGCRRALPREASGAEVVECRRRSHRRVRSVRPDPLQ